MKHFINLEDLDISTIQSIIKNSLEFKRHYKETGKKSTVMKGKHAFMLFALPSTRTRLSFCHAVDMLGGKISIANNSELNIARGEILKDTMQMINLYNDMFIVRWPKHDDIENLKKVAKIPIINALTDKHHPCQAMADMMTIIEEFKQTEGLKITWYGDITNVLKDLCTLAEIYKIKVTVSCPEQLKQIRKAEDFFLKSNANITLDHNPVTAAKDADIIATDTWLSMSEDSSKDYELKQIFSKYQVNNNIMKEAKNRAIFMHCLPAKREQEVTSEVLDSASSRVIQEAENRSFAQAGIISWCMGLKLVDYQQ